MSKQGGKVFEMKNGTVRIMVPQLRAEKKVKVNDIAKALNISRQTASLIANGKQLPQKPEDLQKLCELFGVGMEDLVRSEDGAREAA